jgi:hypothetical protein
MSKTPKKPIPKSGSRKTADPSKVSGLSMDSYHETESNLLDNIDSLERELRQLGAKYDALKDNQAEANKIIKEGDELKALHTKRTLEWGSALSNSADQVSDLEGKLSTERAEHKLAKEKLSQVTPHRRIRNGVIAVLALSLFGAGYFYVQDNSYKKEIIKSKNDFIAAANELLSQKDAEIIELSEKAKPSETYVAEIAGLEKKLLETQSEVSALTSRINTLTIQRDAEQRAKDSAQSDLKASLTRQTELRRLKNGDVPDQIYTYNELRLTFLNYIEKGLGEKYNLSPTYIGCLRGNIIDELDEAQNSYSDPWRRLRTQTKIDIERCEGDLNIEWDKKEAVTAYILREYMYKDGNFLQTTKQNYRGKLGR